MTTNTLAAARRTILCRNAMLIWKNPIAIGQTMLSRITLTFRHHSHYGNQHTCSTSLNGRQIDLNILFISMLYRIKRPLNPLKQCSYYVPYALLCEKIMHEKKTIVMHLSNVTKIMLQWAGSIKNTKWSLVVFNPFHTRSDLRMRNNVYFHWKHATLQLCLGVKTSWIRMRC